MTLPLSTIAGIELKTIVGWLQTPEAQSAQRIRNLYIGDQLQETKKYLDDPLTGIQDWAIRKYAPQTNNITKEIISKSGLLFMDGMPNISFSKDGKIDTVKTTEFFKHIEYYTLANKLNHLDQHTRLLGSAGLVFGYDVVERQLVIDVIHAANSFIHYSAVSLKPDMLVRSISINELEVTTPDEIFIINIEGHSPSITAVQPNTFGVIPIAIFHDECDPTYGGPYNRVDTSLADFNLVFNKQLTQLAFSMDFAQKPTLFITGADPVENLVAGPDAIVWLDGENATVNYKSPTIDVTGINNILNAWTRRIAEQYSVRLSDDTGNVTSGFSLVVKENANMELRKRRQRSFEGCFAQAKNVIQGILKVIGMDISNHTVTIDFPPPALPINEKEQEEIWSLKIKEGRATIKDYFVEFKKMTEEEAFKKIAEIDVITNRNKTNTQTGANNVG